MIDKIVSHYRILGQLGQGGMGVVYRAVDLRLGREVALKFLKPESAGDVRLLQRLRLEARAASALNHPHICTVHDIDEQEGQYFIVMEVLEGATLAEGLREGQLAPGAVIDVGIQITSALAAAHAKGIIHRDIKPGNVFLTRDGRVKVLDFGIAKLRWEPSGLTTSVKGLALALRADLTEGTPARIVMGTPAYMSPEQLRNEELDVRTDIFSTGAVLYELATGVPPFEAATVVETAAAILTRDPVPPSRISSLPISLDQVILKALAKERAARYQTAGELQSDLERVRAGTKSELPVASARSSRRRVLVWGGLCAVIVSAAAALIPLAKSYLGRETTFQPIEALAVLPLRGLSAETEKSLLADGITDALIARLSRIKGVRVISRTSAMRYKNTDKPLRQIAEELGVQGVVEGSVLVSGGRIQLTASLVRARDDRSLWSETYTRETRDVLVLQGELASAIAREIRVALTPDERTRLAQARPIDPEAHYLYLRGRFRLNNGTPAAANQALEDFQAAVKIEPAFALAWVGIGDAYSWLSNTGYDVLPPRDTMPRARAAAMRVLEIEPSGEAHAILGDVAQSFDRRFHEAEEEYERALQLSPGSAAVHHKRSAFFLKVGRRPESIAEARKAMDLDPFDLSARDGLAWAFYFARRFEEATRVSQETLAMEPDFPYSHLQLGMNLLAQSHPRAALGEFERFRSLTGDSPLGKAMTAHTRALLGERQEAFAILRELHGLSQQKYVPAYHVAIIYIGLGESQQAIEWLDRAADERSGAACLAAVSPIADGLRSDPSFQAFLRRLGLPRIDLAGAGTSN